MTYPAPKYLKDDPWFGPAYYSKKQLTYIQEQMYQEEMREKCRSASHFSDTMEVEDIHQVMYNIAISSGKTTIQLNPIGGSENFQGGSEIYHERQNEQRLAVQ